MMSKWEDMLRSIFMGKAATKTGEYAGEKAGDKII